MLIIRETFIAKPGMASKLAAQFKSAAAFMPKKFRVMTDFVSAFNTVVIETEVENFQEFEAHLNDHKNNQELRRIMAGYTDLYQRGKREIFQVM